jgi:hypothetical protein
MQADLAVPQVLSFTPGLTKDQQEVLQIVNAQINSLIQVMLNNFLLMNGRLTMGHPADENELPVVDNLWNNWHTHKIDDVANLCTPFTVDHNFDLPFDEFSSPGSTVYRPNVWWLVGRWQYGDLLETALGNKTTTYDPPGDQTPDLSLNHGSGWVSLYRDSGDTVTRDSIDLRIDAAFAPTAEAPLTVDFFLHPGVR